MDTDNEVGDESVAPPPPRLTRERGYTPASPVVNSPDKPSRYEMASSKANQSFLNAANGDQNKASVLKALQAARMRGTFEEQRGEDVGASLVVPEEFYRVNCAVVDIASAYRHGVPNKDILARAVKRVVSDIELEDDLTRYFKSGDWPGVKRVAHKAKGILAYLWANPLCSVLNELEAATLVPPHEVDRDEIHRLILASVAGLYEVKRALQPLVSPVSVVGT